jgi:hypothetical protein
MTKKERIRKEWLLCEEEEVMIPGQEDEAEIRRHLQGAAEDVFAKLWDNEDDEVWNEYI